ncbi:MAG: extracellular solute-binding protein [Bacilli bacterium]|nr:extracellular solute-binding protein [Bacilli bacterium]MDD4076654.1 extracellular solute-binding protein [Bacilli bacterium]
MRKTFNFLLFLLLFLALFGCNGKDDKIVIRYANWNLGTPQSIDTNMERLMIKEFMNKYPEIKVEIIERPKKPGTNDDVSWTDFLASRASIKSLPDVFMADNIPYYIIQDWAYNLTDLAKDDPEFLNISSDIRDVITYNGKIMAVPCAVFYAGYIVNKTLYNERYQDYPTVTSTFDELITRTKAAANHASNNNTGVVGLEGIEHILHWYPAQLNLDYGWFTLAEDGFHLDSSEFTSTIEAYRELQTDSTFVLEALQWEAAQEELGIDIGNIFPEGDPFNNGNILCKWFYSWDFGWIQTRINNDEYTWDMDFIGTPVVNDNKRVPIVADFFTVAANTKYPEEAYRLAKWMGFGKDGYSKRLELSKTVSGINQVNFPPIQADKDLLDEYFSLYPNFTGLRTIIENKTVIVEPPKYLPGYNDARYGGTYDAENTMFQIIEKLRFGEVLLADIAEQLNSRANALYNDAKSQFDDAIAQR